MTKRVLDVGNCAADHGTIRALLEREFSADVVQANGAAEALAALRREKFDLILVNRIFDADGDDGLSLVRAIKGDPALAAVPVMLITNLPDVAREAEASGAAPSFGKRDLHSLHSAAAVERLRAHLS